MTSALLDVTATDIGATGLLLTVCGELDHDSRTVLDDAVTGGLDRGRTRLVLDLTQVPFCDSGGLSLFVDAHRRAEAAGGWLRLAAARPEVLTVLAATNLDRYLTILPTVPEALAGLA